MIRQSDIDAALAELRVKNEADIEHETAVHWGARACAAYITAERQIDLLKFDVWFEWGEDFLHEAVEHGALVMDRGVTAGRIQGQVEMYRDRAVQRRARYWFGR